MSPEKTAESPLFYKEFIREREAILRHKYYLSEIEGRDVGFERAMTSWVLRHRSDWLAARRAERLALAA